MRTRPLTKREKAVLGYELSNAGLWLDENGEKQDARLIEEFERRLRAGLLRIVVPPKAKGTV